MWLCMVVVAVTQWLLTVIYFIPFSQDRIFYPQGKWDNNITFMSFASNYMNQC